MTALPRYFRIILPLGATIVLAACDTASLLPPDARLPDGSTYTGDIKDGHFHGEGVQEFPSGMVYRGDFQDGYWHGQGELDSPAGWHYEGGFQQGVMSGHGVLEDEDSRYEGYFQNSQFHGQGRYEIYGSVYVGEFADGDIVEGMHLTDYGSTYTGEFRDWVYHGEGSYYYKTGDSDEMASLSGTWEDGEFIGGDEYVPEAPVREEPSSVSPETILAEDRQRLDRQIDELASQRPGVTDAYFLAVGGDGRESVFMRDIEVARKGLQSQFDVSERAIMLLNHRDYEALPLATRSSIETALEALDAKMDPEEDLLVVHLVSHGGTEGQLLMAQPGINLSNLTPGDFAEMLEPLRVRRKLLVVSACYSGHWVEQLEDPDTLIMASARKDRTSFGCGDDSEMTWFTKAVYRSVGLSLEDPKGMFDRISKQIRVWEKEIGMEEDNWSHPQYHLGENFQSWLERTMLAEAE